MANCSSGAVKFVFSMKNKKNLKCFDQFGVRSIVIFIEFIQHEKEVLDISKTLMRFVVFSSNSMTIGISCDSWHRP